MAARIEPPFSAEITISGIVFDANSIIAMVVAPIAFVALALFLQRTNVGIAIRASAGNADRAMLLGVPVKRLQTVVWAVAGLLAFILLFAALLRARYRLATLRDLVDDREQERA